MASGWIAGSVAGIALATGLAGCVSAKPDGPFVPGESGPFPEIPAGQTLPFSLSLPAGFEVTLTPGLDIATYTIKSAGQSYLYILNQQFPAFNYRTDWRGRVRPRVQQRIFCHPLAGQGQFPPHRQILHLQRDWIAPDRRPVSTDWDFILVWERVDLPAEQQALADQIAASVHVPGMTAAIPPSALMTCP